MDGITSGLQSYLDPMIAQIVLFIPRLIAALVIFLAALVAAGWVASALTRWANRRGANREVTVLISRLGRWAVIILGSLWALETVDRNITGFIAGLGILGFTLGFALQDIAKNFVAGMLLLVQQPFNVDDTIGVAGFIGKVTEVSMRATELRTLDGLYVLIPNADVFVNPITNYTRSVQRRFSLNVGVDYSADLEQATRVALDAIQELPGLMAEPAPALAFNAFGDSSIDFTLYYWVDLQQSSFFTSQDQAVKLLTVAFRREGIEIPFPIRTVHLRHTDPNPDRQGGKG